VVTAARPVKRRLPIHAPAPAAPAAPAAIADMVTAFTADLDNLCACYEYLKNDGETLADFVSRRSGYVANPKFAVMATIARANGESKAQMMNMMAGLPDDLKHSIKVGLDKKCTEDLHAA
jgi:hypothetical protein